MSRVVLFGSLAVVEGEKAVSHFPTQRARALLAYLAYFRSTSHPREYVAEMLWPGANPDAIRLRLNQTIAEVRKSVRPLGEIDRYPCFSRLTEHHSYVVWGEFQR